VTAKRTAGSIAALDWPAVLNRSRFGLRGLQIRGVGEDADGVMDCWPCRVTERKPAIFVLSEREDGREYPCRVTERTPEMSVPL